MIKEYSGITFDIQILIEMQQTGDHIRMAWNIGSAKRGAGVMLIIPAVKGEKPHSHLWAAAIQPLLWVNQNGNRFCNESTAFQFPLMANALANQKEGILFTIFDEVTKEKLIEEGIDASVGIFVPATTKLDRLEDDLNRGIEEGNVFAANSIQKLADNMSVDRNNLAATIAKYNECCHNNYDSTLAKPPRLLQSVEKPTFYAVKCSLHIFTTLGGIKINHKTEVLDSNSEPIPGLYATGNCAGGMYGFDYDVITSGGALGFAINSGRIAAENGLEFIGNQP
jgi:fumarate reductase flavoprotein subunit